MSIGRNHIHDSDTRDSAVRRRQVRRVWKIAGAARCPLLAPARYDVCRGTVYSLAQFQSSLSRPPESGRLVVPSCSGAAMRLTTAAAVDVSIVIVADSAPSWCWHVVVEGNKELQATRRPLEACDVFARMVTACNILRQGGEVTLGVRRNSAPPLQAPYKHSPERSPNAIVERRR